MTGLKKYPYVDKSRPPMTNWASEKEVKVSYLRARTVKYKAKSASITEVDRPVVEVGPAPSKLVALPAVQGSEGVRHVPKLKRKARAEETKNFSIGYVSILLSLSCLKLNVNNIHVCIILFYYNIIS